jgi:hypothetical protein
MFLCVSVGVQKHMAKVLNTRAFKPTAPFTPPPVQVEGVRYKPMRASLEPRTERGPGFRGADGSASARADKKSNNAAKRAEGNVRRLGFRPRKGGRHALAIKSRKRRARKAAGSSSSSSKAAGSSSKDGDGGTNSWLRIACSEGKNRQIRKV